VRQGGEVYVELPCITAHQGRRPAVCYLIPDLVEQFGQNATLPQSPPLIAEIASPDEEKAAYYQGRKFILDEEEIPECKPSHPSYWSAFTYTGV
jgi:Uma2 family endonuclease